MSAKKGFAAFIRPPAEESSEPSGLPPPVKPRRGREVYTDADPSNPTDAPPQEPQQDRVRTTTSTGRVRTHSAGRDLPAVSYRMSEERWERLKMMSLQQRRPIQEMLGEAMEQYMRAKGLPW